MSTLPFVAGVVLAASILASCGGTEDVPDVTAGQSAAAASTAGVDVRSFGACDDGAPGDHAPTLEFMASATGWIHLRSVQEATRRPQGERFTFEARGTEVDGSVADFRIHSSFWDGIDHGLESGADVWLATADPAEFGFPLMVMYVVVLGPGDVVYFPGDCSEEINGDFLRSVHGSALRGVLERSVGSTGPALSASLGLVEEAEPAVAETISNPDTVSQDVLAELQFAKVHFRLPAIGTDAFTVCSKSSAGWNDCIPLTVRSAAVDAFIDDDGVLEIWLLDGDARLTEPVRLLGRLTVPDELRRFPSIVVDVELVDSTPTDSDPLDRATLLAAVSIDDAESLDLPGLGGG